MTDQQFPGVELSQSGDDKRQLRLTAGYPHLTAAELFAYFTRPALLTEWWPPTAVLEPRPGGRYAFTWPAMDWTLSGEYLVFEPEQRLLFTCRWRHEPDLPERRVEIVVSNLDQGSQLQLTHEAYGDSEREQADRQSHLEGWTHFLERLWSASQK
jgi:uncharacterized protein YndB with AHSA1/START domain